MNAEVVVLPDAEAVAWEAAGRLSAVSAATVRRAGRFTVAFSGGSTPRSLFHLLALAEWQVRVPWEHTTVFWVDERTVPPDHPDSNFGVAQAALFSRLLAPPAHLHRWVGEATNLAAEAERYATLLREAAAVGGAGVPRLDLVLLGMGADGHTASLFPGTAALDETRAPTAANFVPALDQWRLTLTLPAINAARQALFLVTGADKAEPLARVLGGGDTEPLPAARVAPADGALTWLVDQAAVRLLPATAPS